MAPVSEHPRVSRTALSRWMMAGGGRDCIMHVLAAGLSVPCVMTAAKKPDRSRSTDVEMAEPSSGARAATIVMDLDTAMSLRCDGSESFLVCLRNEEQMEMEEGGAYPATILRAGAAHVILFRRRYPGTISASPRSTGRRTGTATRPRPVSLDEW